MRLSAKSISVLIALLLYCCISTAQIPIFIPLHVILPAIDKQQPVLLNSGDVAALSETKRMNIKYDYEVMAVCNFSSQEEYFNNLTKNLDENKALAERGNWEFVHKNSLSPEFEKSFNTHADKIGLELYTNTEAKQPTLVVKVLKEEPFYHKTGECYPYVELECTFLDKEGNFVARLNLRANGELKNNYGLDKRLGECYKIAGKLLAKDLLKRFKKLKK